MSYVRSLARAAAALLGASTAAAPLAAQGVPLGAPDLSASLLFNYSPPASIYTNQFGARELTDSRYGAVSFAAYATPSPSLSALADVGASVASNVYGRAAGTLYYSLRVVGPTGQVPVLIDVAGNASAIATSGATFAVESRWNLLDYYGTPLTGDWIRSGQLGGTFGQSFNRTVSLSLATNRTYTVFMKADAGGAASLVGSRVNASAYVDPVFSFGAGVDPQSYSFAFSSGIGNSPALAGAAAAAVVPEPATLVLVGAGLLVLGWARGGWVRLRPA
jgi:hypothetical protein